MGFGTEQLLITLETATAARDEANRQWSERRKLESDNLRLIARLRNDIHSDPVELQNAELRARAYERSVRALWDDLQKNENEIRRIQKQIAQRWVTLDALRDNLALAERSAAQFDVNRQVAALEQQIAEVRRKQGQLVDRRDSLRDSVNALAAELDGVPNPMMR